MSSPATNPAPSPGSWVDNLPFVAAFFAEKLPKPWQQWSALGGAVCCLSCILCCIILLIFLR